MKTHCQHEVLWDNDCVACEKAWVDAVVFPTARKAIAQLLKFYGKQTLVDLVLAQDRHIEKLQSKVPPLKDDQPRKIRA